MRQPSSVAGRPLSAEVALLRQVALVVFILTVGIGILNGTDIVDFEEKVLLAHVHGGTLGWITTSVFAASLWLFTLDSAPSPAETRWARWLSIGAVITVPLYVLAFMFTYGYARPIIGAVVVLIIAGFLVWILQRSRKVEMTTPHLAVLAAVATSVTGGVLGVLWGIQIATGNQIFPEDGEGSHPATMVLGFLVPVGMGLAEWGLSWPRPARLTKAGMFQVGLPFIGGVLVMLGILLDVAPLLQLSLPFEITGVIILLVRMWPGLRRLNIFAATPGRHAGATLLALPIDLVVFVYLIANYAEDFDLAPLGKVLVLDHLMFIGVMTNAILALLLASSRAEDAEGDTADHVIFWGVNIGLVLFVIGLWTDTVVLKQIGTPIMGTSILIAIAVYLMRVQRSRAGSATA